ncbi:phosphotransferase family protein [Sphingobium sufflavum]|uniref:phosphotransferase family protein n=1 Tax=Sphingobium sufflavum TaxID=1129547 RepID=UPI001F3D64E3|nr:phosphotransferase family protein [Sphingobium sufflavum]MCE7797938.1 phosphotransferase family protein [Sphingobium sufflavum]
MTGTAQDGGASALGNVIVAPETRALDELVAQLTPWLQARLPQANDLGIVDPSYPSGAGQSHETILFDAHWTENGAPVVQGCVVRIKPIRHQIFPDDLFIEQYRVMEALHRHGVRVAKPLWLEEDAALLGAPFFIMERVQGRVAVSIPPYREQGWVAEATPAQRRHLWEEGVRHLASIHTVPLTELQFLAGPEGARDGLKQEWDKYVRFVDWVSEDRPWPVLKAALERLRAQWPANQPAGLVWGDSRLGNLMYDANFDVVAIMDWEQPSLGGALHDLAWWLTMSEQMHGATAESPHLDGMGTRAETIALWEELTGISAQDIEWYEDFTRLKSSCLNVRMSALKGRPAPDEAWLAQRLKVTPPA